MITVPVSASMYQTVVANIQQIHAQGDGTIQVGSSPLITDFMILIPVCCHFGISDFLTFKCHVFDNKHRDGANYNITTNFVKSDKGFNVHYSTQNAGLKGKKNLHPALAFIFNAQ